MDRYVIGCRHSGCKLKEVSTYARCQSIAAAHTLATGHREIVIARYDMVSPSYHQGALAT